MVVPMAAVILLDLRQTILWYVAFVLVVVLIALFDPQITRIGIEMPDELMFITTVYNLAMATAVVLIVIRYLVTELEKARARADNLLLNILPAPIAEQLKEEPGTIADGYQEVTVLFADIVDFTRLSADADPVDVVTMLNAIFSDFDGLAEALFTPDSPDKVVVRAVAPGLKEQIFWVNNNAPVLSWTGELNYESDGLNPEVGYGDTTFAFRIVYTDADNDAPAAAFLWLDRDGDGLFEMDERFSMFPASAPTYSSGVTYFNFLNITFASFNSSFALL